ncbi:potassium channel family protein [Halosimplex sp. TS25]|uniref:potassium channel family protein n=1 Tax=Halosimplex rarum TaxID=3396619 RepID=UPI0039E9F3F6
MRELRNIKGLHPRDLTGRQRLLLVFAGGVVTIVLVFTYVYYLGVHRLEGRDYSIFRAFQTVIETFTTTGYGADSPWETPAMNLLMVTIQVTGIAVGLVTLRVLVIPLYERTPINLDNRLTGKDDHVVVAEYGRDSEVLLDELEELGVDYVLVDTDLEEAKRLSDEGYQAIDGDPETRADLDRASIDRASLLITDTGDRTASVVLTALEANEDLRVISFTESTRRTEALAEIGVDRIVATHALIGRRLAEKATTPALLEPTGDESIAIREILVRHDSPLEGVALGDSPVAAHPDLTVVAGWFDGELRLSPAIDERLSANTVLVVAGPERAIDAVASELSSVSRSLPGAPDRIVVAGFGEGGTAAVDTLPDEASVTTVDADPSTEPDVVGDTTEPGVLRSAGIAEADALVVTVDDDATALMTVAMARSLTDDLEILARVTDAEKTSPAFRAGADYVLSAQRVSARLVASEAHGERVMDMASQIRLVRANGEPFAGKTVGQVRRETERGWTVVGASRDGAVHTNEETEIVAGDDVFVAGSDETIREFQREYDPSN